MKKIKLDRKRSAQIVAASMGLSILLSGCGEKLEKIPTPTNTPEGIYHTVTFQSETETYTFNVSHGDKVYAPAIYWPEGYQLDGWVVDNKIYNFNSGVYGDLVLTPKWVPETELEQEENNSLGR